MAEEFQIFHSEILAG